jgi:uncharacterized Tic20 family protein
MADQAKPKRGRPEEYDDQDIVDLDALMRDYAADERPRRAARLDDGYVYEDDEDAAPKRKNDPARRQPRIPETGATVVGIDRETAKRLKEQLEEFLRTPYEETYAAEYTDSSGGERLWAALAHLSLLIGIPIGAGSGGTLTPLLALVPLLIYFFNRQHSRFVAKHTMQSLIALLASTLGWIALLIGSGVLGVVLTIVLAITIVGVIAIPFIWLGLALFWLASFAIPIGAFFFSLVGAVQALRGRTFRYPYVGKWVR